MAPSATPLSSELASLKLNDPPQNLDTESPNAMALDTDDTHVIPPSGLSSDKDDVAEITPETSSGEAALDPELPRADDCTFGSAPAVDLDVWG